MTLEKYERELREPLITAGWMRVSPPSIVASITRAGAALILGAASAACGQGQKGSSQVTYELATDGGVLCGSSCDNVTPNGTCVLGPTICPGADAALLCTQADCDILSEPAPPTCPDGTSSISPCIYLPLMAQNGHCGWGPWICLTPDAASGVADASAGD